MRSKFLFIVIIQFSIFSCGKTDIDKKIILPSSTSKTLLIDNGVETELLLSRFISNIEYTPLVTNNDNFIGNIRKIIENDKYYAFLDLSKKSAWIFDKQLNFVEEIALPEGRGPGQLEYLNDITFGPNDTIFALGLFKILEFKINQGLIDEIMFRPQLFKFFYDSLENQFVGYMNNFSSGAMDKKNNSYNLINLNKDGDIIERRLLTDKRKREISFLTFDNFPVFNNEQLFFSNIDFNIYSFKDSKIEIKYILNFPSKVVTEDVLNKRTDYANENSFLRSEIKNENLTWTIGTFLESKNTIFIQYIQGRGSGYFSFDKSNEKSSNGKKLLNDVDNGVVPFFLSAESDSFLGVVEPYDLITHLHKLREDYPIIYNSNKTKPLIELVNRLSSFSNPIFIKASTK